MRCIAEGYPIQIEYAPNARAYEAIEISLMRAQDVLRDAQFKVVDELTREYGWERQDEMRFALSHIHNAQRHLQLRSMHLIQWDA